MPSFTIIFGIALMAVGIFTYVASTGQEPPRTIGGLLPALFGLIALTLGIASLVKKDLRMHLMHAAVLLAALGVIIPLIRLIIYLIEMDRNTQMNLITVALSAGYVYVAVQSFRKARTSRRDGTDPPEYDKPEPPAEPDPTEPA